MRHEEFCLKYPEVVVGYYNEKNRFDNMYPNGCEKNIVQWMVDTLHTPVVSLHILARANKIRPYYMRAGIKYYDDLVEDFNNSRNENL